MSPGPLRSSSPRWRFVLLFPETWLTVEARSLASSSSPSITDDESDQQRMKGKWKIVRCEFSGQNQDQPLGVEDTIADGKWHRPKRKTAEYQFKLDPTKDPKWIDLTAARLGNDTLKGIYLLERNKLTLCYAYDPDSTKAHGVQDHLRRSMLSLRI